MVEPVRTKGVELRFGILGPLEVRAGGGEIKVRGKRRLPLLLRLLISANRPVSAGRLIEDIWGEQPSEGAASTLESHVSELRRLLGRDRVVNRSGGYALGIDSDELDAWRFERLYNSGRQLLASSGQDGVAGRSPPGATEEAKAVLAEALGCWRGAALEDVAGVVWAQGEARRLDELHEAAVESWIEAHLALGENTEAAALAEEAVVQHPYRERASAHLMVALYRSGRQTDALAAYGRLRQALGEDLGLVPSPEMSALEHAILTHDPSLRAPVGLSGGVPVAVESRHNLPAPLSSFIGREEDSDRVTKLLDEFRLVTLTGAGGSGKTRLALHVASGLVDSFSHGVWFADLAALDDPSLVPQALADALGFRPRSELPLMDLISDSLRYERRLLVVDNCEHLIDSVAAVVEQLLRAAPNLRVLATSREALRIGGEAVWLVRPLAVPDPRVTHDPRDIWACESVRLFVERAVAAYPDLDLANDAATVSEIVTRLDGLPLAIELAAARVNALLPVDILAGLDDRFRLLAAGSRTAPPRQQTLAGAIEWSHRLLNLDEKRLLARASVFAGGFDLAAVQAVVNYDKSSPPPDIGDDIESLVAKSLLFPIAHEGRGQRRHRFLETIREYANDKLASAGREIELACTRAAHAEYYAELARAAQRELTGPDQERWLSALSWDHDNFRVALNHLLAEGSQVERAIELFGALSRYWFIKAQPIESLSLAELVLGQPYQGRNPGARAQALLAGLWVSLYDKPNVAWSWGQESLQIANEIEHRPLAAEATSMLACASFFIGQPDPSLGERALSLARLSDEQVLVGLALLGYSLTVFSSDRSMARALLEEALSVTDQSGDRLVRYIVSTDLGEQYHLAGELRLARQCYEAALSLSQALGYEDPSVSAAFGLLLFDEGDVNAAVDNLLAALKAGRRSSLQQALFPLYGLAHCAVASHQHQRAATLYGFADDAARRAGLAFPDLTERSEADLTEVRAALLTVFDSSYQSGGGLTWDDVTRLAHELLVS